MKELNYEQEILDALLNKEIINEELYEKCQPKYISALPGTLRSTSLTELEERYSTIMKEVRFRTDTIDSLEAEIDTMRVKIDDAVEENDKLQKNLDEYEKASNDFIEESKKSQQQALDEAKEIRENWDGLGRPNNDVTYDMDIDEFINALENFGTNEFANKGFLTSAEVDYMKRLSQNLEYYAMGDEYDGGPYSMMSEELLASAEIINEFADNYDINNGPVGDALIYVVDMAGQAPEWREAMEANDKTIQDNNVGIAGHNNEIAILEKERTVLLDNATKTQNRMQSLQE